MRFVPVCQLALRIASTVVGQTARPRRRGADGRRTGGDDVDGDGRQGVVAHGEGHDALQHGHELADRLGADRRVALEQGELQVFEGGRTRELHGHATEQLARVGLPDATVHAARVLSQVRHGMPAPPHLDVLADRDRVIDVELDEAAGLLRAADLRGELVGVARAVEGAPAPVTAGLAPAHLVTAVALLPHRDVSHQAASPRSIACRRARLPAAVAAVDRDTGTSAPSVRGATRSP